MEVTIELVGKKQQWIFNQPEIKVGREAGNDVRLAGNEFDMVSRSHALLRIENGACYVEDANSPNGTFLNGKQVQRAKLFSADVVRLGADGPELKVRFVPSASEVVQPTLAGVAPRSIVGKAPAPALASSTQADNAGIAQMVVLEQKLDGLRKLLAATLALVAFLATIVIYQGYMISHTQDT